MPESAETGMGRAGARLREIRCQRGLSLTEVAARAEVTKGFLSLAERGMTNVSVPVLMRICDALDIGVGELFEYPSAPVVRSGAGAPVEMGGHGVREVLLTPKSEGQVQVMHTVMRPGGGSGGAYRLDATTIFVYVLRGALAITVDRESTVLNTGDCLTFGATQLHDWHNPTDGEAEVLWTIAPPIPAEDFRAAVRGE
ncbi:mannose-6-phosphate isomerase-like protein (cupin superfamily)/DNA-binding Xre family transcriptional regulator [Mycobacterium frederiksbergense]|uniref:Mannose-6-phosphate isomerase-like protein (Cupin superfamily)/DNA-binding Xre family transcriptional regulator n=1 Tax=Mycolicibacterium frederiksbergense TaxID=117567 RepID=A0ABT6L7Y0_9MYCO|nr:XRE family transcriptional regulator [Mycolicibacterium frederiksbergense]MDH6199009.1 mannose-6-phosphate isomerase-like protein (cupin superfamily)/DNA-binding Xre family transcriptional regulator [Mycolicibacterium frederiksbergense]